MLAAEVLVYLGILSAYVQCAVTARMAFHWFLVPVFGFAGGFPIAANLIHGDCPADSGLRLDNLKASSLAVGLATAIMAAGVVIVGLALGSFHWESWRALGDKVALYMVWGIIQQYLLQAFVLRRLMQAGLASWPAAVLAAACFGLLHAPNWPLVGLTTGAGIIWCRLFLRQPNLVACH